MMLGYVNSNREAIVQIAVSNERKQIISIQGVIDTGYSGDFILPREVVNQLGLTLRGLQDAILGDGSIKLFEMYAGIIIWDGEFRRIEINSSETGALLGMGLLEGYKLEIEGQSGGKITITAL